MVTLREANEHDVGAIAQLHADSWRSTYRGILSDDYLDNRVHSERAILWQTRFSEKSGKAFFVILAEMGSDLSGFACVFPDEDPTFGSYVDNLHVAPQLTRQGIGRRLLVEVARRLIADETPGGLYLWVMEKNLKARQFYSAVGAVEVDSDEFSMPDNTRVREVRCSWPDPARLVLVP